MNENNGEISVHVASIKMLVGVWVALMVGTWLTVAVTYVDLGPFNIWIGIGIASVKAVLVALFFMHLRWDKGFNAFAFLAAFGFLAVFIGIALMDTMAYAPTYIPDYAPWLE